MKEIKQFAVTLFLVLVLVFGLHLVFLYATGRPLFDHLIIPAYLANYLMAFLIYYTLFRLKEKYLEQLGFIFMFGSMIKFIVFFIFFYPVYKSDGNIDAIEFSTFFIPYAISLIFETLGVIKFIKK